MGQALKEHARVRITQKTISTNLINITPEHLEYNNYCNFVIIIIMIMNNE